MDLVLGGGRHTAPTTGFGRAIHQRASELSCRAVAERLVRLRLVVVLQPLLKSADHSCGIGPRMDAHVVWLEGLHEGGPEGWRGGALRVADRLRWRGDLLDRHHAECAHDSPSLQRLLNPSATPMLATLFLNLCSGLVAAPYSPAVPPFRKFMRGEPIKPARNRVAGRGAPHLGGALFRRRRK